MRQYMRKQKSKPKGNYTLGELRDFQSYIKLSFYDILAETDKAFLIYFYNKTSNRKVWLPKKCTIIEKAPQKNPQQSPGVPTGVLMIPEWLVEKQLLDVFLLRVNL